MVEATEVESSSDTLPPEVTSTEQSTVQGDANGTPSTEPSPDAGQWVTLREAAEHVGMSVGGLRKWYRDGKITSRMLAGPHGDQREVLLSEVEERAGRRAPRSPAQPSAPTSPPAASTIEAPPGAMIVPLEAWNRILDQLGNIHTAGQELAEARERAARAETIAEFEQQRRKDLERRIAELEGRPVEVKDSHDRYAAQPEVETPVADDPSPAIYLPPAAMNAVIEEAKGKAEKPETPAPDELVEKSISEAVEEAAARRSWWMRAIRRGRR